MAVEGFLLVDKPAGWTSHDVVAKMRGLAGTRKIGHAGTLDPMATGLLVLGLGRATRLLRFVQHLPKEYVARAQLGDCHRLARRRRDRDRACPASGLPGGGVGGDDGVPG